MMRRSFRWLSVLALAILLAGCGASTTRLAGKATATATPLPTTTPKPTATPLPTPAPTATPGATSRRCSPSNAQPGSVTVSGVVVSPAGFGALAYGGVKLPDDVPLQPFALASTTDPRLTGEVNGGRINPDFSYASIYFGLRNTSTTTSHRLDSISMRISALTPYTGRLNEWLPCTPVYTRSTPPPFGCGGGEGPGDEVMQATFSTGAQVGSVVQLTQVSWDPSRLFGNEPTPMGPLPITLRPGNGLLIEAHLAFPGASGTYGFTFGPAFDGESPAFVSPMPPIFLAPIAHIWSGDACKTAAMQAQIPPATNPPTYYLCPNA